MCVFFPHKQTNKALLQCVRMPIAAPLTKKKRKKQKFFFFPSLLGIFFASFRRVFFSLFLRAKNAKAARKALSRKCHCKNVCVSVQQKKLPASKHHNCHAKASAKIFFLVWIFFLSLSFAHNANGEAKKKKKKKSATFFADALFKMPARVIRYTRRHIVIEKNDCKQKESSGKKKHREEKKKKAQSQSMCTLSLSLFFFS